MKHRKYAYSSKTLLMNTLNNCRVNPSLAVCIRSFNYIPHSKSMRIMPRGHIETDPSTSSYFVTLSLEYPKGPCVIGILAVCSRKHKERQNQIMKFKASAKVRFV